MNWDIIGHQKQLDRLGKAVETSTLSHAYLFAGPVGVGKMTVAKKLAEMVVGPITENFNPDLLEVGLLQDKSEITIAQIRDLSYKLSLKPYSAQYKVAIIDNAESMNSEAANALLKVLEEPKPNTIIILITSNPNRLPKTIVSRTQKITFGELSPQELKQITTPDEESAAQLAQNEEYYQKVFGSRLAERLTFVTELAELETPDLKILLVHWLKRLQVELRHQASLAAVGKIKAVAEAVKLLDQNANSKLLLANLMISI